MNRRMRKELLASRRWGTPEPEPFKMPSLSILLRIAAFIVVHAAISKK